VRVALFEGLQPFLRGLTRLPWRDISSS